MTSDFKTAYRFDDAGYFEHELSVQVIDGEALMPPSATLLPPGAMQSRTTRFSTASTASRGSRKQSQPALLSAWAS